MNRAMISNIGTIPPGLVIVTSGKKDVLDEARLVIVDEALRGGSSLGLQFDCYSKVVSLYAGTAHQEKHIVARHRYCEPSPNGVEHKIAMVGSRPNFDFCCDEASATFTPMIRAAAQEVRPTLFILCQAVRNFEDLLMADTLNHYRNELVRAGATGIIMLASEGGDVGKDLPQLCEEFIEVDEAEPDYDVDVAMTFDCHSLRSLRRLGIGKTMCGIRYADQRIRFTYAPFISNSMRERVMWSLRCSGRSYAEIGEVFGINKSTVMRQLKKLPNTSGYKVDDVRINEMLEHLDIDEYDEKVNAKFSSDDDDDDDLDD